MSCHDISLQRLPTLATFHADGHDREMAGPAGRQAVLQADGWRSSRCGRHLRREKERKRAREQRRKNRRKIEEDRTEEKREDEESDDI